MKVFLLHLAHAVPLGLWAGIAALGLFFWLWIFGHQGLYELEHLRQMRVELLQEEGGLLEEKARLERELTFLDNPAYLKHLIHQELGYVEKGELMIQFPPNQ